MEVLKKVKLKSLRLGASFFDSLREDYGKNSFEKWFNKKASANFEAYVKFDNFLNIKAFLMLQIKNEIEEDIVPFQSNKKRIKISTLKIDDSNRLQRLSESVINIIFAEMGKNNIDEAYITLFKEKQPLLYNILSSWGFIVTGTKGAEIVMTKFSYKTMDTVKKNYKWYFKEPISNLYENSNFYLIPLEAVYHDKLLPNNKLLNVENQSKEFDTSSISISKTYISKISYYKLPKNGDFLLEYRMSDIAPKTFNSVVTGVGIVNEVHDGNKMQFDAWLKLVGKTLVFTLEELKDQFNRGRKIVIKFFHILSFGEGNNVTHNWLRENEIWPENFYLPAYAIKNRELIYKLILERLKNNENLDVNT